MNPNLIIIGAQKSGTTSMHRYLDKHPDIHMSYPIKEPGYFLPSSYIIPLLSNKNIKIKSKEDLLENNMKINYKNETVFGESSTYYTIGDLSRKYKVAKSIYKLCSEIKFIYIVRNPLARLKSNYSHEISRGYTNISFEKYMKSNNRAVKTSMYFYQLQPYLEYFNINIFRFVEFDKFVTNPKICLQEIYKFLGVSNFEINSSALKVHNKSNTDEIEFSNGNLDTNVLSILKKDMDQFNSLTGTTLNL